MGKRVSRGKLDRVLQKPETKYFIYIYHSCSLYDNTVYSGYTAKSMVEYRGFYYEYDAKEDTVVRTTYLPGYYKFIGELVYVPLVESKETFLSVTYDTRRELEERDKQREIRRQQRLNKV